MATAEIDGTQLAYEIVGDGAAAREGAGLFERWPLLAPQLLDFAG